MSGTGLQRPQSRGGDGRVGFGDSQWFQTAGPADFAATNDRFKTTEDLDVQGNKFDHSSARPWSAHASTGRRGLERTSSPWERKSRETLRFRAYFTEKIPEFDNVSETIKEKTRVRKMVVTYYLEDSSLAISEIKVANSGLPQGRFLRRVRLAKDAAGTLFHPTDFAIGHTFEVNNRMFHVVDADTRTRKWFQDRRGEVLPAALPFPDDGFDQERAKFERSGRVSTPGGGRRLTNMYDVDKTVLRFFCAFQSENEGGGAREYHIHYFIEDDTMEIKAVATEGMTNFPYLLRRQKMPLGSTLVPGNDNLHAVGDQRMVSWEDLRCGGTLEAYGHTLLLMDCDEQTRQWYSRKGITQKPMVLAAESQAAAAIRVPPYNGFGDEEDLYAMGLSLQPAMSTDKHEAYRRFMQNENKVMRFRAHLLDLVTGDRIASPREFVINYFMEDDTISVFEPELRNSGISGGLFLTRMRYKKYIDTQRNSAGAGARPPSASGRPRSGLLSRWFRPSDFVNGADLTFEMPSTGCIVHRFKVLGMDEYTRRLLEKGSAGQSKEQGDVLRVVGLLAEICCSLNIPIRSIFTRLDPGSLHDPSTPSGRVPESVFRAVLTEREGLAGELRGRVNPLAKVLTPDLLDALCWEFVAASGLGFEADEALVDYADFCDALVLATPEPRILEQCDERNGSASELSEDKVEESMLKVLRHQFARGDTTGGRLRRTFREVDEQNTGLVGADDWFRVLRKHSFQTIMPRAKADAIRRRYSVFEEIPVSEAQAAGRERELLARMDYNKLCDDIYPGNFDEYVDRLVKAVEEYTGGEEAKYNPWLRTDEHLKRKSRKQAFMQEARAIDQGLNATLGGGDEDAPQVEESAAAPYGASRAPMSNGLQGDTSKVTLRNYLADINAEKNFCGGDELKQVKRSMQCFASSFGRTHRKKLLRKTCMAFDPLGSLRLNKSQFLSAIRKSSEEGFVELNMDHAERLANFFYPKPATNEHSFESLLQVLFSRDIEAAKDIRSKAQVQKTHDKALFR